MRQATAETGVLVYAFTCGYITLPTTYFIAGGEGKTKVPACSFLIDHPDGLAVFDTGFSDRFVGLEDGLGKIVDMPEEHPIAVRLEALDVDPGAVQWIINSHLHLDHAGGNRMLPNATVIVQEQEWDFGFAGEDGAYSTQDFDIGQTVKKVRGEHDVFGDGSVTVFPTPGHTPGHQSARIRTATGEAVLAGDCCNFRRSLDEMKMPENVYNADHYRGSLESLSSLRRAGARIFYGHDPDFWSTVPQATELNMATIQS
ncbi:N-acyl homoserine lactonase family protein [Parerythrobacter jejuensis]|uniref:MBL fold metallo-hydrolase n=1 Tax=Parerythrobacter jejuensis TaxID=795812 RepID=A0A845AU15_9SPHN|nr:N-acyl homoserine lactonase family protein [Parerythrobacter jejuensis]MXP30239.1 MBL fold metallo-hydrolase [Parerythrobacter jejuensis]MXP32999.1 MBL fold metallo-hydrolase [Parerythrobacter jejuensis]